MKTVLIITKPFGDYKRGARIEDPAVIAQLRASHNASKVVVTEVADDSRFSTVVH